MLCLSILYDLTTRNKSHFADDFSFCFKGPLTPSFLTLFSVEIILIRQRKARREQQKPRIGALDNSANRL
jgi:hypothetical protein